MKNPFRAAKGALRRTPLLPLWRKCRQWGELVIWIGAGRPVPPPHIHKQRVVREYAARFGTPIFVETGTFLGEMVNAVRDSFEEIYSIELSYALFEQAKERFSDHPAVHIIHGDSAAILREQLAKIKKPATFWLDGHYSGGITAQGKGASPILEELSAIREHPLMHRHVLLIDDARYFTGHNGYPPIEAMEAWAKDAAFGVFEIKDDIIRIHRHAGHPL